MHIRDFINIRPMLGFKTAASITAKLECSQPKYFRDLFLTNHPTAPDYRPISLSLSLPSQSFSPQVLQSIRLTHHIELKQSEFRIFSAVRQNNTATHLPSSAAVYSTCHSHLFKNSFPYLSDSLLSKHPRTQRILPYKLRFILFFSLTFSLTVSIFP